MFIMFPWENPANYKVVKESLLINATPLMINPTE